jgi:FSR family fosmidomycin resistance protein-like MFS transporter
MYIPKERAFWSVGFGHLANDIFMSMGSVILVFMSVAIVPMTNTQIGFAISAQQLAGALSQPAFGLLADKNGGKWLGAGGLMVTMGMFVAWLLVAITTHNYFLMIIPFICQGFGSGAVHPVGMLHSAVSNQTRAASNMSYFFLMGQMGLALGPILAGLILDSANPNPMLPFVQTLGIDNRLLVNNTASPLFGMMLIALPIASFMLLAIPTWTKETRDQSSGKTQTMEVATTKKAFILPFVIIGLMVTFRGLANPGSVNFIPALFQQKGWSPAEYGFITSLFWISAGISGVVFGNFADRYDRRWVMFITMAASAPTFFLLPLADGGLALILALGAGSLSGGVHSIIVVLAQEAIPAGKGLAGGAILGFIFATGALGSLIIGSLADAIGLATTFQFVSVAVILAGGLSLALPKKEKR